MSTPSIRELLYEPPGPRVRRRIRLFTAISLVALAALLALMLRQFAVTGQFAAKYWFFFARATTWRFLGQGLLTTLRAALTGALIAFALGFVLMRGRLRGNPALRWLSTALIEFTRGVPTLLFIYFFFLVIPQTGWKLSAFWKITLPCAISACGVLAEALRSGVNAVPRGADGGGALAGTDADAAVLQGRLSAGHPVRDSLADCRAGHRAQGHDLRLRRHLRRPHAEREGAHLQL